jgi:hypothetical protein
MNDWIDPGSRKWAVLARVAGTALCASAHRGADAER